MQRFLLFTSVIVCAISLIACGNGDNGSSNVPANTAVPTDVPWQIAAAPITISNAPRVDLIGRISIHDGTVSKMIFSNDSRFLATMSTADRRVNVWDLEIGNAVLGSNGLLPVWMYFSDDNEFFYLAHQDNQVQSFSQWAMVDGQLQETVELEMSRIGPADRSLNRNLVAIGGQRGRLTLIQLDPFEPLGFIDAHPVLPVAFVGVNADGSQLVSLGDAGDIKVWDTESREVVTEFPELDFLINQMTLNEAGDRLAVSTESSVRVYDTTTADEIGGFNLDDDGAANRYLGFSPDNRQLYFYGNSDMLEIRDFTTSTRLVQLSQHNGDIKSAIYSPDGNLMLVATIDTIYVWDLTPLQGVAPGTEVQLPRGEIDMPASARIFTMVWSPDGRTLAVSSEQGDVFFFGVPGAEPVRVPTDLPEDASSDDTQNN